MIKILFFAQLKERLGCSEYNFDINSSVSVSWLREQLANQDDHWHDCMRNGHLLMAVNQEIADESTQVNDGDEVAFFPPVTGG